MPRILFISSSWPRGRSFGGQLRALHIGRALKHVGPTSILVVSSEATEPQTLAETKTEFEVLSPVVAVPSPKSGINAKVRRLLDPRFMNQHGCLVAEGDRARIAAETERFDLVWVLNSRTPNILLRWHWSHTHLDVDDVPSTYFGTLARNSPSVAERLKARVQQGFGRRRELLFAERFTTISVCSQHDRTYINGDGHVHVIPNGFERPTSTPKRNLSPVRPRLGFIGLFSYLPNADGIQWFVKECWADIQRAVPDVTLRLIGKGAEQALHPSISGVNALGWVADPAEEIATWSAMIIPIRFGGGTRIKIAEAFSRKCPAVSTHVGAFGYEVKDGEQLLLADRPNQFSRACIELVQNPERGARMAERAWADFLRRWTWDAIAPKVWTAAEDCLRLSQK